MQTPNKLLAYGILAFLAFVLGMNYADAAKRPLRVAVIDSGFGFDAEMNKKAFKICKTGSYDFTKMLPIVGDDEIGHGTAVMSLIERQANTKGVCYMVLKVFDATGETSGETIRKALRRAIRYKADIVNMSLGSSDHNLETRNLLKFLAKKGTKIFVAAGNEKKDLNKTCNSYPSCYKNVGKNLVVVGALDEDYDVAKYSNYGSFISVYKYGRTYFGQRGTSFAAPRAAGDYIKSLELDKK